MLDRRRSLGLGAALVAILADGRRGLAQETMGEVAQLVGGAQVIRGAAILPLVQGAPVLVDDIVRTAVDGRVLIHCLDGLRIAIGSASEVALRVYLIDRDQGSLRAAFGLLQGIVRLISGNTLQRQWIDVDTRTAVASVRSTEWLVEATARGTGVLSLENVVEVRGLAGGRVLLEPGEGTDVAPGSAPRAAARWGSARRLDAIARTSF